MQLSLSKGVPMVVSGINEGKSDVNARVEFAGVGISLKTERPKPQRIAKAVQEILSDAAWRTRAQQMRDEFAAGDPAAVAAAVVEKAAGLDGV